MQEMPTEQIFSTISLTIFHHSFRSRNAVRNSFSREILWDHIFFKLLPSYKLLYILTVFKKNHGNTSKYYYLTAKHYSKVMIKSIVMRITKLKYSLYINSGK